MCPAGDRTEAGWAFAPCISTSKTCHIDGAWHTLSCSNTTGTVEPSSNTHADAERTGRTHPNPHTHVYIYIYSREHTLTHPCSVSLSDCPLFFSFPSFLTVLVVFIVSPSPKINPLFFYFFLLSSCLPRSLSFNTFPFIILFLHFPLIFSPLNSLTQTRTPVSLSPTRSELSQVCCLSRVCYSRRSGLKQSREQRRWVSR